MSNVPRGLYRNKLGIELTVGVPAFRATGVNTLGDDISHAEIHDDLFGPQRYLVTAESLRQAGYDLHFTPCPPVDHRALARYWNQWDKWDLSEEEAYAGVCAEAGIDPEQSA